MYIHGKQIRMHMQTHTHAGTCACVCACTLLIRQAWICECAFECTCTWSCTCTLTCTYTHTHTYACVNAYEASCACCTPCSGCEIVPSCRGAEGSEASNTRQIPRKCQDRPPSPRELALCRTLGRTWVSGRGTLRKQRREQTTGARRHSQRRAHIPTLRSK